jgi:hypothetical protein
MDKQYGEAFFDDRAEQSQTRRLFILISEKNASEKRETFRAGFFIMGLQMPIGGNHDGTGLRARLRAYDLQTDAGEENRSVFE